MTIVTDVHFLVTDTPNYRVVVVLVGVLIMGGGLRKPFSIWCDLHLPHAVQHILELIMLLIVAFGMSAYSSWIAVLLDIGRNWNTLTYLSIQRISNSVGGIQELGFLQLQRILEILGTWGHALSCGSMTWPGSGWLAQQLASRSCHDISVNSNKINLPPIVCSLYLPIP